MKLLTLFFSAIALAGGRSPEGDTPIPRPPCNQGAVEACVAEARRHEQICLGYVARVSPGEAVLAADLGALEVAAATNSSSIVSTQENLRHVAAELEFLDLSTTKIADARDFFLPVATLEKIFQPGRLDTDWVDRFPDQRLADLLTRNSRLRAELVDQEARNERISSEIAAVKTQRAEIERQKNSWFRDIESYRQQVNGGCRQRHCSGGG